MNSIITQETLSAFREGDHKAFEIIFLAYYSKVKFLINSFIKSDADAEDLTEELFVNLWVNHISVDTNKSFHSYLHTVAYNAAINFLKHKLVHETYISCHLDSRYSPSSEDEMICKETSLLIDIFVNKMPAQRRQIFILSRYKGMNNGEIATFLNTTKRNVETQLSLAIKELRKVSLIYFLFMS
jgi:RNA polymerase sigma-70 factor (ECF subfamily)